MTHPSPEKLSIVSNSIRKLLLLAGMGIVLIASPLLQAGVVFTTLHSFTTNLNGGLPYAPSIQGEDGFLYGTTTIGGATRLGTVYRAGTNGMFTLLYSFTNGIDGSHPTASLIQGTDGNFYGTAERGGANGHGTIFEVSSNGVFNPLYSFTGGADGGAPESALIEVAEGEFYGTASTGGAAGYGAVYEINTQTNPAQFILLYSFTNGVDGATPTSALVAAGGGVLYGTATSGGASSHGAIFELTSAGAFSPLYSFTNGLDGSVPLGLTLGSDGLYGMAQSGGIANAGTIFKMTFGGALTALYSFTNGADGILTEYGAPPVGSLALGSDGAFYGVADDGSNYTGTIFKITPQGAFALVTSFDQIPTTSLGETSEYYFNVGGNVPTGLTLGIDGNLYGTATYGGGGGYGTILELVSNSVIVPFFSFGFADGKYPDAGVIQGPDGNFYGPTYYGGLADQGAIFKMDVAGNTSLLYSFTNGLDGAAPDAPLTFGSDGNLFGTTFSAFGTVFRLTFEGMLTTLHKFTNGADGSFPSGPLGQFGSDFYGTTDGNTYVTDIGAASYGTVFEISTNGTLNTLHTLATTDGTPPLDGVTEASDGNFYGITFARSSNNFGGVFKITPSGVFTSLYAFTGAADGAYPIGGLVQGNDGSLYGTTSDEGRSTFGGIFRISTNGLFTPLYSFTNGLDGSSPSTTLLRAWDGNLYGTTGTEIFQVTTNGVLTVLYSFTNFVDFLGDPGPLLQATDGDLYGTTTGGGIFGVGTVFRLAVPMPPVCLSANLQTGQANFTWRAVSGLQYQAQYTTNLAQANWLNLGAPIGSTNGLAHFSDPIAADSQRFYRLLTW